MSSIEEVGGKGNVRTSSASVHAPWTHAERSAWIVWFVQMQRGSARVQVLEDERPVIMHGNYPGV
jgi:hypothetical protein